MPTPSFLLLEDNQLDAEVVRITLLDGGIDCDLAVVDTRPKFEAALASKVFDLILADYALPGFDGMTALKIARDRYPDMPFIFVSASIGEELAIEALKMGATDYVLKHRLGRLGPCVERALREAQEQRDRKAAEAALQESEARFKGFAENHKDVIWISNIQTHQLVYVSPSYAQVWGSSTHQLCAHLDGLLDFIHPDDRDRVQSSWQQCTQDLCSQEYRVVQPNGTVVWIRDRCFPIYDDQGKQLYVGGIAEDISDRKQAEATITADLYATRLLQDLGARLTSEGNIQVLYNEIMAAAIALTKADAGTVQILDQATQELMLLATQGFSAEMMQHFHRVNTHSQTSCGVALSTGQRCFIDVDDLDQENRDRALPIQADARRYLSAQSTPLITRSGYLIGMVSTYWCSHYRPNERELRFLDLLARQAADLIEQRQAMAERQQILEREQAAREEAERANRIKDEFLAVLSHELRSPLNPILGWTQLLQNGKLDVARQREALATIERNAKLQAQLIEDLLDISRIIRGKLSLNVVPVSLTYIISAALETVQLAAEAKNIQINLDLAPDVAPVSGDAARLQQVVWNLLTNAVKFTPNRGQVTVELRQFDRLAQMRVIDTGKGINPQFLPHVFEYFLQEDGSTTRKFGGLGLGLAIARQIVQMHGGIVWAESLGEGQGATFIVQLPTMHQQAVVAEPSQAQREAELPLTGIQVLLVDDEPDTRAFQAFLLEQSGASVTAVASGLEALQALKQSSPDVVVSDIGMPEMDGYMLIQQIRSHPSERGERIPAVALTAYATEIDQQRALQSGFQTHITKPVEPEALVKAIAGVLDRSQSIQ